MRFRIDDPNLCEKRVVIKFAFFPTVVEGYSIWLERYLSHQKYILDSTFGNCYWKELSRELLKK